MNLTTLKLVAGKFIPLVPVLIGALLGVGGTKAMETKTDCPTVMCQKALVEVKCIVPTPLPIKVEFLK